MITINRIGYKLGAAALVGIIVCAGMAVNQQLTQRAIADATRRANVEDKIRKHVIEAGGDLNAMRLANASLQIARSPAEAAALRTDLDQARVLLSTHLQEALSATTDDTVKQRLAAIQQAATDYVDAAREFAELQIRILAANGKRSEIAATFAKGLDTLRAAPALAGSLQRAVVEERLGAADVAFGALREAAWHYAATADSSLRDVMDKATERVEAELKAARTALADDSASGDFNALGAALTAYGEAVQTTVSSQNDMASAMMLKIRPAVDQATGIMHDAVAFAERGARDTKDAAEAEAERAGRIDFALSLVVMLAMIGAAAFAFIGVARPLTRLTRALGRMAAGETALTIPGARRGDEIGDLARTVVVIADNAEANARTEAATRIRQDEVVAQQRRQEMRRLAGDFETRVGQIVETVSAAAHELETSAGMLAGTADRARELTSAVVAASDVASSNVQSVATATEELSSSVGEISRQVQDSARIAGDAVAQAERTNARVGALAQAANRIGDVVELINTIAGQTNLLALNATIEAARAGDAGRGFAVVASEVKQLAEQTAKATGEISQQIGAIQAATGESVGAIRDIGQTIGRMAEIASAIAAAIEQQGAATQEISRNVQRAAQGTQQVSGNVTDVQRGAAETGMASSHVLTAAQALSVESARLKSEVAGFLDTVRAA
ncbi:methyl-accepting chemotaxis protein [Bradyrhizobium sp. U87765 SZCCT0131]|uniref:methyl-accepting chemotaxis protein n=1 Tax=unclassified Bradyrhizobium TaxID=2631580 RepID=UPI001BA56830|nr:MULTISPECIES: HAMP domain-containing methyl-accepting chemotaxis protein [unclassified Bradyrhizobium]MBR1219857.1 methyl-accepting chemotaxis protein [Bradyrhizobium sp. U87765 SZCCT0131]MBR1262508.1 methyl-accepting chemotaxis protein [Bradyrhizobium sp. U87765 SZCCT0134]MBR1308309.1 methyl-accepting chemotaxis protein [Bradyrhizobium sp. U87765 SZCCT0110]MBR1318290.1 methyl-accepting chemotaxis protein [Bradyrhizobium sp. U87765 SZCCT0109]MBR1351993.1 methyl-accepting chemotaxis protein 